MPKARIATGARSAQAFDLLDIAKSAGAIAQGAVPKAIAWCLQVNVAGSVTFTPNLSRTPTHLASGNTLSHDRQ
jgi:hypothetical protein